MFYVNLHLDLIAWGGGGLLAGLVVGWLKWGAPWRR
jgi:hypothetical protein